MNFKIEKLHQFTGFKTGIYSIYVGNEQKTVFTRFLEENFTSFKSEIIDINSRLISINRKTSARDIYFKLNEGNPGDGVCALYDEPDSKLRLYCIRYGNALVVLGGGGYKPKTIRKLQDSKKLTDENYLLREISQQITERLKTNEIGFSEDGTEFTGNLDFNDYE